MLTYPCLKIDPPMLEKMAQALQDLLDICDQVSILLKYNPLDSTDAFQNHLTNLKEIEKLFNKTISSAARTNIDVEDFSWIANDGLKINSFIFFPIFFLFKEKKLRL
jgi:hypothetical protein